MMSWLLALCALGLGIYIFGAAIALMANVSLMCVRHGDTVSCELRWTYPLGIVHTNQIPNLRSVSVKSRPLRHSGSVHFLVLNPDEPSWPFGPLSTSMTRDSAWAAAAQLEKFIGDPTRNELSLELSERSLWLALVWAALGVTACLPFACAVWFQVRL